LDKLEMTLEVATGEDHERLVMQARTLAGRIETAKQQAMDGEGVA
jgi:hypothetical protein